MKAKGEIIMEMAAKLKELRMNKNLDSKDVLVLLEKEGFEVSEEELLKYEENAESLDADLFLALCRIYGCKDIMETFKDTIENRK